jgi:hypothetical protein
MGNSELGLQMKASDPEVQSAKDITVTVAGSNGVVTNLSYSLDKGLDEYEEITKAQSTLWPAEATIMKQQRAMGNLAHVGSEPILTHNLHNKLMMQRDHDTASSGDEAQKHFLQNWQAHGPAPVCSDEDTVVLHNSTVQANHSSSNLMMERNKHKEDISVQQNGLGSCVVHMRPEDEGENSFSWNHELEENGTPLPEVHSTDNAEDTPYADFKSVHHRSDVTPTVDKNNMENGGRLTVEDNGCVQELATFQSLQSEALVGRQNVNELHTSTIHDVTADNSRTTVSLKNCKEVEDSVFPDAFMKNVSGSPAFREGSYEAMGMKQLSCKDNSDLVHFVGLGDMLESSIVDSVLTRRTEALASRTASFNLVRARHGSSLEDGSS